MLVLAIIAHMLKYAQMARPGGDGPRLGEPRAAGA